MDRLHKDSLLITLSPVYLNICGCMCVGESIKC